MTAANFAELESRLRDAYADAAATIGQEALRPYVPGRRTPRRGRLGVGPVSFVPLTAAAAVAVIAVAAVVVPRLTHAGSEPRPGSAAARHRQPGAPPYMMIIPRLGEILDVRNAVTGVLTATLRTPVTGSWSSVAAQGQQTFVAVDRADIRENGRTVSESLLYRIGLTRSGKVASTRPISGPTNTSAVSITPDGRYAGYVSGEAASGRRLVIMNLDTGKAVASWQVPANDWIESLSIDAAGNAIAVGYYFRQWIHRYGYFLLVYGSVLRTSKPTTSIRHAQVPASGDLEMSPDGSVLYELGAGYAPSVLRSPKPVKFQLLSFVPTKDKVRLLHTWLAPWYDFRSQVALAPQGRYLLIAVGSRLATVDLRTRRYTVLPGEFSVLEPRSNDVLGQTQPVQSIAW